MARKRQHLAREALGDGQRQRCEARRLERLAVIGHRIMDVGLHAFGFLSVWTAVNWLRGKPWQQSRWIIAFAVTGLAYSAAVLMVQFEWHFVPATLVCLLAGAAIGAAQGWFVAFFRIPSFIVTLAGMLVFKGLSLALLQGQSVGPFPTSFQLLSSGFIPDALSGETLRTTSLLVGIAGAFALIVAKLRERANQARHGMESEPTPFFIGKNLIFVALIVAFSWKLASYKGLPNVLIIMTLLMLLYDFVTTRTTVGRRIYALGGNEKAARLSGVKTQWLSFYTFVNMGMLAAIAGLVFAARLNTATPKAGLGFELDVIAACFIGGASASGGVGKVLGAVIGAFVMGVMNNGMSILGIGIDYQQVIKGLVLLAAVFVDVYNKGKN